ncbi:MAG: cytochrome c maturation protein CcmE [Desulfovibrionaceae bacterium]
MKKKDGKYTYVILASLFVIGLFAMVYAAISQNSVYFLNVAELMNLEKTTEPMSVRVFGTVDKSYQAGTNVTHVVFTLIDKMDKSYSLTVEYNGVVPDAFKAEAEVIAEGSIVTGDVNPIFQAKTLLAKCPSKYQEKSEAMTQQASL